MRHVNHADDVGDFLREPVELMAGHPFTGCSLPNGHVIEHDAVRRHLVVSYVADEDIRCSLVLNTIVQYGAV